ncbi:MAG TPA: hypothetical protein VN758_05145 [Solirubrobacterales bacterium]|nr:hypothetical protein [Solirubrobacterales bacterium]
MRLMLAAALSLVSLLTIASSARAVSPEFYGLMWNGQYGSLESASDWDAVAHSGAKVVRVQGFWKQVADQGDWTKDPAWEKSFDKYFTMAAERNISILPYLYGRQNGTEEHAFYRSSEMSGWLAFVWTFVQRYGRGGTFWNAHPSLPYKPATVWEVWNEPNLKGNNPLLWDGKKWIEQVQPRNYAEFLVSTSTTITEAQNKVRKAGEPFDTKILTGGLYQEAGSSVMSVSQFFEEISKNVSLNNEFKSKNSGLGLHPYSFAGNEAGNITGFQEGVNAGRAALTKFDSSAKPIWITEMGWPVDGEGYDKAKAAAGEMEQASLLTSSYNWLKEQSVAKNIEFAAWYNYSNYDNEKWSYHCGLRNWYGIYRPSWWAYQEQTGAPAWPKSTWHIDNLGGGITADPDISSWGPGRLDVFGRGTDNKLYHKFYASATGWSIWENLGGILTSGPGAVSWGANRIDVVARATDNTVSHWAWTGSSWVIDNLGGGITADPDISSWGPGRLDVFVRGTDNKLYHKFYASATGWSIWENLGGILTSGPSAVSWGTNRIDVVANSTEKTVTHWAWNGSSWTVDDLGGNVTSDPDISSSGPGNLDIYSRDSRNSLIHKTYTWATGWSGWSGLGGMQMSGPGAVSWGSNRTDVVTKAPDGSVAHWAWAE